MRVGKYDSMGVRVYGSMNVGEYGVWKYECMRIIHIYGYVCMRVSMEV